MRHYQWLPQQWRRRRQHPLHSGFPPRNLRALRGCLRGPGSFGRNCHFARYLAYFSGMGESAGPPEEARKIAFERFTLLTPHLEAERTLTALSRSLKDVITIMEQLGEAKAGFRSFTEAIDTTTPAGRMMMQMVGAFAEFERAMLRERTKAGPDTARQDGRIGGRRPKLTPEQQTEIGRMVARGKKSAADAARLFKVHPATVSRLLTRLSPGGAGRPGS